MSTKMPSKTIKKIIAKEDLQDHPKDSPPSKVSRAKKAQKMWFSLDKYKNPSK